MVSMANAISKWKIRLALVVLYATAVPNEFHYGIPEEFSQGIVAE